PEEPKTVAVKERKIHFPVQIAKNLVGIKEDIGSLEGQAAIKQEIIRDVALEMLFGTTSATYLKLYNEGIIDDTFGYDYTLQDSFSFVLVGG
ncbi:peptidase M16, partial [Escherichia coli]|nr:peptidase M16 [Escherichia coli]